ncbi:MAG: biotin--[acetyl-CoA-carboxylase] ligase [Candidatus Promineifilaceae bacterium]|nr:biotin--[acetyl-CoA-carboxylase] ligase [Candidatus Promineifilaceae bacterium]
MSELSKTLVEQLLTTQWLGHAYQYLESVESTNDVLKQQIAGGDATHPASGTVVLTDFQSRGRGRFDRRWEAPPGSSLLLSILLRPEWPSERSPWLTMLAGTAIVEAIEEIAQISAALKWPNDIVIQHNDEWHKVCGILSEGHVTAEQRLAYAVLGIGINVNIAAADLPITPMPSTSLAVVAKRPVSRLDLLLALLRRLEQLYDEADRGISPQERWSRYLMTIGRRVEVSQLNQEKPLVGLAEGTGEWGQLLVRDDQNRLHTIMAGDVTLRMHGDS